MLTTFSWSIYLKSICHLSKFVLNFEEHVLYFLVLYSNRLFIVIHCADIFINNSHLCLHYSFLLNREFCYNIINCSFSMFQGASPIYQNSHNMLFQYICFSFSIFFYIRKKSWVDINFSKAFVELFLRMYDCCSIPQVLYQFTMICDFTYLKLNMNCKLPVHSL